MCGKMLFLSLVIREDLAVNCLCIPRAALKILGYMHAEVACVPCMVPTTCHEMLMVCGKKLFLSLVVWLLLSILLVL